jgi:LAS superfamily LD-carboxypeptidase LdcB
MNSQQINFEMLTGRTEKHVEYLSEHLQLNSLVQKDFMALKSKLEFEGIDLRPVSSFRSYQSQVEIWNDKVYGKRVLNNIQGEPINIGSATTDQILDALLAWSAVPGSSRHHWGSEIDVYDHTHFTNQRLQLIPSEYENIDGPCHKLYQNIKKMKSPFTTVFNGTGKIQKEPWHISHVQTSKLFSQHYTFEVFERNLSLSNFELIEEVKLKSSYIYAHYILPYLP